MKNSKRVFEASLFSMVFALLFAWNIPALAADNVTDFIDCEAFVVSQDGCSGEVKKIHEQEYPVTDTESTVQVVYDVVTRAQDYSTSTSATDSSASARAYLTINYRISNSSVLLTGVSGRWERLDPTVTVGTTGTLRYGCQAAGVTNQIVTRGVSNNFSLSTGFGTYVPNHASSAVGANLSVPLTHGSSRWTVYVQNNVCP